MKKLITLASVGVFLLSLQGASLAQEKTPAGRSGRSARTAGCGSSLDGPARNAGGP